MNNSEITRVRKVAGGKYELELTQVVDNPEQSMNVAAMFNADDDRFKAFAPKARKAWQAGTPAQIQSLFGIDVNSLTYDAQGCAVVSVVNPSIEEQRLVIQLTDTHKPNYSNKPKQTVKDGVATIFTKGGKPIYQSTSIVGEKSLNHTVIKRDGTMTAEEFAAYCATVGSTESVESENLAGA